ncbi:hypothetical protein P0D88_43965 [Paraburkholderia sp. RL18-103-BIB-C]|uniref:hypothetical protein n=1 Tax=Paraburkholderia sp. RL18-103-BIB-C TaxID=3031637 RepID=UPI0038B81AFF
MTLNLSSSRIVIVIRSVAAINASGAAPCPTRVTSIIAVCCRSIFEVHPSAGCLSKRSLSAFLCKSFRNAARLFRASNADSRLADAMRLRVTGQNRLTRR